MSSPSLQIPYVSCREEWVSKFQASDFKCAVSEKELKDVNFISFHFIFHKYPIGWQTRMWMWMCIIYRGVQNVCIFDLGVFCLWLGLSTWQLHFKFKCVERFETRNSWRMPSSGMLCCMALVRIDVSKEPSVSIIRVRRIGELEATLAITSNWCMLWKY
jgi:hypothetical protein